MNILAILAVRNERAYIANALTHLVENGVKFAVIDNESTDGTIEIVKSKKFRDHLVHFETLPFRGSFDLEAQLLSKQRAVDKIKADWYIHLDADEIMHSYSSGETLCDAISRLSQTGAEVVNFDEFVFLPIKHNYLPDTPGPQPMCHYYFFEPKKMRLMRAWKATVNPTLVKGAGHKLDGDLRVAKESMALRHYIFRDAEHARAKYVGRRFSETEVNRGWHRNRIGFLGDDYTLPKPSKLHVLSDTSDRCLKKSFPKSKHYWQWPPATLRDKLRNLIRG